MKSDPMGISRQTSSHDLDYSETSVQLIENIEGFTPLNDVGLSRYRYTFPGTRHLDLLLNNRRSHTLIVSFHGALDRSSYILPRFERFASLNQFPVSALYLSDPSLWVDEELTLAWYAGWENLDLFPIFAELISAAALSIDAKNIILTGSSGGGFAALQISALLPESLAVVFNPQTSIYAYEHPKWPMMPQRWYLRKIWNNLPGIDPENFDFSVDWTMLLGDRLSAVRRYEKPTSNYVYYLNNTNDVHHIEKHFEPFAEKLAGEAIRLKVENYDGGAGHRPPSPKEFREGIMNAAKWRQFNIG